MREVTELPTALMLFPSSYVPSAHRPELERLVRPIWLPDRGAEQLEGLDPSLRPQILASGVATITNETLSRLEHLRLILLTSTAFDFVDIGYCTARGIQVCNTPDYTGSAVAEYAFALLLAQARRICELQSATDHRAGSMDHLVGTELDGKTAGIVGFGNIGQRVARIAAGFDMDVIYVSRGPKDVAGAKRVGLNELLESSDVVFVTLPLTPETHDHLGTDAFRRMKPSCILVSVSPGGVVNRVELAAALSAGRLASAAIDLPHADDAHRLVDGLMVTPGHGWYTAEGIERRASTWIRTLAAFLHGEVRNGVNLIPMS